MAINTEIWGASESWVDGNITQQKAEIKFFSSTREDYAKAWQNGYLPWNTIDYSSCFWGIGKGSIWTQPHFIWAWCPSGDTTDYTLAAERVNDPENIPALFSDANSVTSTYIRYSDRWKYLTGDEHTTAYPKGVGSYLNIYASFNYQKIIAIPFVCCVSNDSTYGGFYTFRLNDYFDNERYNTYPEILGLGYNVAYGDGIDSNRTSLTAGASLIVNQKFAGNSAMYNSNKYFARDDGFDLLLENQYNNSMFGVIPCGIYRADQQSDATVGDSDTGFRYKYCTDRVDIFYYDSDNPLWQIAKKQRQNGSRVNWNYYPFIECTADNADTVRTYLMQQIAFLGLPFVIDSSLASRGQIGDTGVYLPKFDTDGITTGEYEEGDAALRLPNSEWTDGRTGSGYDPTRKPGNEDFGDLTNRRPTRISPGGLNYYVANFDTIYNLQRFLNGAYTPSAADLTADFKGTNPGDYIISVFKFPVSLPSTLNLEDIYIGKINAGFKAYRLIDNAYLDFGTLDIDPYFSTTIDFRDYQSKILLLMPFIGTAELDPKAFIGHSLSLIYNVDYLTGSVAAEIKRDGLTIETRTAKLAQTVPFFAGNMGQYQNEIAQTGYAIEQSKIKQITGAVTTMFSIGGAAATAAGGGSELAGLGSGAGIIRGASNMLLERINQESLEYRLEHTQPQIGTISTASAGNAFLLDDRARVLIWRPYMLPGYDPETYSHVVGNATLRAAALSEFSGYTVAAAAELSNVYTIDGTKSASEQELKLIKQALLAGVYV